MLSTPKMVASVVVFFASLTSAAPIIGGHNCGLSEWPHVGKILIAGQLAGTCSSVSRRFVLTAKHTGATTGSVVQFDNGQAYTVYQRYTFNNPSPFSAEPCDVALLDLGPLVTLPGWYDLFTGTSDIPARSNASEVTPISTVMVGYGNHQVLQNTGDYLWGYTEEPQSAGTKRAGMNQSWFFSKVNPHWDFMMACDLDGDGFDALGDGPETSPYDECQVASKDSGGPVFILDGTWKLAGLHLSFQRSPFFSPEHPFGWGSQSVASRVTVLASQIQEIMNLNP